ncbi:MAG: nucleotidyltransferase domain-containing protein [Comamonadaceae bacterium]|nr:nucleotidyltransferase domain-containing protein [Comamonadaceae bacterium]
MRPLLAARWVEKTGGAAPIEFEKLLTLLQDEPAVLSQVHKLLEQKRNAPELGRAAAVPILNEFIEAELAVEPIDVPKKSRSPQVIGQLNELFHNVPSGAWGKPRVQPNLGNSAYPLKASLWRDRNRVRRTHGA